MSAYEVDEGLLRFTFDDRWRVIKWDDHPAHRKGINEVDKSKALDFIGIYKETTVFFIEVKDYRHHGRKNPESIWNDFEAKIRNTVAGLVGARRRRDDLKDDCSPFLNAVCGAKLLLVLWVEAERPEEILDKKSKVERGLNNKRLKQFIKWLNARVITCSLDNYADTIPGLQVRTLPRPPAKP